jgi:hypothetical protein
MLGSFLILVEVLGVPSWELVLPFEPWFCRQGFLEGKMIERRGPRRKQATSFQERLARFSLDVRERANNMPPGEQRTALMKKLEQTQRAVQISQWLGSPNE